MASSSDSAGRASSRPAAALDILDLDADLSEEEILLRDTVRRFVDDRILPNIADWYDRGYFEMDLVPEMAKLGVFGMTMKGYGGGEADPRAYGIALRELEAGDSGIRSFISVQSSLSMFAIYNLGSEEQKNEWLPQMAAGTKLGCYGLTEPDAGSNPSSMRTFAKQKGGKKKGSDWEISGTKMWITNGTVADLAVIWAQTDEGIRGFIVPTDSKGFTANEVKQKMSMRVSLTAELSLDQVVVPESMRLPKAAGLGSALSCLTEARFGIAFGSVGSAMACLEAALDYAQEREVFDKPLASLALTQEKFADMVTHLGNAWLVAMRLARLKAENRLTHIQVSYAKRNNVAAAREVARTARSILGANGISLAYPPARHMANLESVYTYEGTHEIHTLVLGQHLTGHSAF